VDRSRHVAAGAQVGRALAAAAHQPAWGDNVTVADAAAWAGSGTAIGADTKHAGGAAIAEALMDDSNVWIVLECPRGAERELASQGEAGYPQFSVSDAAGRLHWLKYLPLWVARNLAGEFGGKGGYSIAPDELQGARPRGPVSVRSVAELC
jgi:hypothetical protein